MSGADAKILVTGATGFTGGFVLAALEVRGRPFAAFARPGPKADALRARGVDVREGDLDRPESLEAALRDGCDRLINVASLGFGHADRIVGAVEASGVRRAVFVSTTAIFTRLAAPSKAVRVAAEERIRASALDWTILRPTMIYGTAGDRNLSRLVRWLERRPFVFVPGSGRHLVQPVHVEDVAEACVRAVLADVAIGRAYAVSGGAPLTFLDLLDAAGRAVGRRRVWKIRIPAPAAKLGAWLTRPFLGRRGISPEQIDRLNEDKAFPHDNLTRDLGLEPRSFDTGVAQLVEWMARSSDPGGSEV